MLTPITIAVLMAVFSPTPEVQQPIFPRIISGNVVFHGGIKFLCGNAREDGKWTQRYVINMEADWQIWEPGLTSEGWNGFDRTYQEICGSEQ